MPARRTVLGGLHFVLAFVILIYALFGLNWQPERAAFLACAAVVVTALLFGYDGARASVRRLLATFVETGEQVIEIVIISAAAGSRTRSGTATGTRETCDRRCAIRRAGSSPSRLL